MYHEIHCNCLVYCQKIIQAVNTKTNIKLCIQLSCVSKQ